MIALSHIPTSNEFATEKITVKYQEISLEVSRQTGNWYPPGEPWNASIRADISKYTVRDNWRYGLSAFGETRRDAIMNAYRFASQQTIQFPALWLTSVLHKIETSANVVSLHIKSVWKGGYDHKYYWQVFVDGHHFISSNIPYWNEQLARSAGAIALLKLSDYFTTWSLSD